MELQLYYPKQQHQNDGSFWREESLTLELRRRRVGRQSLGRRRIMRHLSWRCAMETCHSQFDCRWRPDDGGSNRGPWAQVTLDCWRLVSPADRDLTSDSLYAPTEDFWMTFHRSVRTTRDCFVSWFYFTISFFVWL